MQVTLRESCGDPNELDITYTVKRHMSLPPEPSAADADSIDDVRTLYASDAGFLLPSPGGDTLLPGGDIELSRGSRRPSRVIYPPESVLR